MFKKPATLKPASPLRSSARRAFVAHLQSLYPALAHASAEQIAQVVPNGLKQCGATTSAGHKAVLYTDEHGCPLWFEVGHEAGAALQQSQQQHKNKAHKSSGQGKSSMESHAEVIPTVYALWILPTLLPRLPTWPQIVDPTLLSGSSLMVPGLIPAPHTFPDELQWQAPQSTGESGTHKLELPTKSALVAVTPYPSPVPLVVARLEEDMEAIVARRAQGEKGKAASTLHAHGDFLWEIGGKLIPPSEAEITARSVVQQPTVNADIVGSVSGLEEAVGEVQIAEQPTQDKDVAKETHTAALANTHNNTEKTNSITTFTPTEVDEILHLSLLTSLKQIAKQQASSSSLLPMPTSALYSSYVLPNRPSHWPPRDVKGRERRAKLNESLISTAIGYDGERAVFVAADSTDVHHSTAKKVAKWVKVEEKKGFFTCKDAKGKDTVLTSINTANAAFKDLDTYFTVAQAQQQEKITMQSDIYPTTATASHSGGTIVANSDTRSSAHSTASASKLSIVIERFWRVNASGVKLFQEMGCTTSTPLPKPVIRAHLLAYIVDKQLVDPRNQAMVRIEDPHLTHALYPKATLGDIPAALRREDILERLLTTSCIEFHRTSRLLPQRAAEVAQMNGKGGGNSCDWTTAKLEAGEQVGIVNKGAAQAVKVDVRTRQGRKVISLITNLDVFGVDAEPFAAELMRIVGASASATLLPASTPKHAKYEVFVQGDQRKAIVELLETQHGLDRSHVQQNDHTKK